MRSILDHLHHELLQSLDSVHGLAPHSSIDSHPEAPI